MRCLFIALAWTASAAAQPADCPAEAVGPTLHIVPRLALEGRPGVPPLVRGQIPIDLGDAPIHGTYCGAEAPPPESALRGAPAPKGLLQGDGPRDVLHNRWRGEVTIRPAP
jgi:hypothetical protein